MSKITQAFANNKAFIPFITCGDPDLTTTHKLVKAAVDNGADIIQLGIPFSDPTAEGLAIQAAKFITCGDPDLTTTHKLVKAAVDNGADIIQLGIPFSDPTAEGLAIQAANLRALKKKITTDDVFNLVQTMRQDISAPFILTTYANAVFSYGIESFFERCAQVGAEGVLIADVLVQTMRQDISAPFILTTYANAVFSYGIESFFERCAQVGAEGVLIADVPYEEKDEFEGLALKHGVELISLVSPTSEHRIAKIAKEARGFVYIISSLGNNKSRDELLSDIRHMVKLVREHTDLPCAVGIGISTPEQAKDVAAISDGAVVGSAILNVIAQYGKEAAPHVGSLVKSMKDAVNAGACAGAGA